MKWKETTTPIPKPRTDIGRAICDGCGADIKERQGGYDQREVILRCCEGSIYPECDARDVEEMDCCLDCWETKVKPALEALGFKTYSYDAETGRMTSMPELGK
jgi:hypothetical protein